MARRRRRAAALDALLVAASSFLLLSTVAGQRAAAFGTSLTLVVFAWGKWKAGRIRGRWRRWKRKREEQIDAGPAVAAAGVLAAAALWWAVHDYLEWIVGGVAVAAAALAAVMVVVSRRASSQAALPAAGTGVLSPLAQVTYKAGGFDPRDNRLRAVKFGKSTVRGLDRRMRDLTRDTGNPYQVRLIAYGPGGFTREKALHRKHAGDAMKGEWFAPTAAVVGELFEVEVLNVAELRVAA